MRQVILGSSEGPRHGAVRWTPVDLTEDLGDRPVLFVFLGAQHSSGKGRMHVTLNETDRLDFVLKKFRRQVTKAGLFQDMKKKRFYESPAVQRRRKSKAARRRNRQSQE